MRRLLLCAVLVALLPGAAPSNAGSPADRDPAPVASPAPPPSAEGEDAKPAKDMERPHGAQVLPLPPPDATTARGQERGNAELRTGRNPTESSESEGRSDREK